MIPALTPPTAIQKPKEGHCVTDDGVERKVLGEHRLTEDGCIVAGPTTLYYVGINGLRAIEISPVFVDHNNNRYDIEHYCSTRESALSSPRQESQP